MHKAIQASLRILCHSLLTLFAWWPLQGLLQCSFSGNPSWVPLTRFYPKNGFLIVFYLYATSLAFHTSGELICWGHSSNSLQSTEKYPEAPVKFHIWWSPSFRLPIVPEGSPRQPQFFYLLHVWRPRWQKPEPWKGNWSPELHLRSQIKREAFLHP